MNNLKLSSILLLLFLFFLSTSKAQELKNSEQKTSDDKSRTIEKVNETTLTGDKIIFKDGATSILEIENEGNTSSIMFPNAGAITPSSTANKLYNNNGNLYWGTNQLGLADGGVSAIDDLSDAITNSTSIYLGSGSGASLTNGFRNIAIGIEALNLNEGGSWNTAVGDQTLKNNKSDDNTAIGSEALKDNTTGNPNTAIGRIALWKNTIGSANTAIGKAALSENTNGSNNVSIGVDALFYNNGDKNVAIGRGALGQLSSATTFNGNIAIGYSAGYNETGSNKLYIENSASPDPLIYGDFTDGSEMVKINGDLYSVGRAFGGNFLSSSTNGVGVKGIATATGNPTNYGGYFTSASDFGRAVYGEALATDYILGVNIGGYFTSAGYGGIGVYGSATKTGADINNIGGKFEASGDLGIGIHASAPSTGWAGYFNGNGFISNKVFIGTIPQTPQSSLHIKQQSGVKAIRMEYDSDTDFWDTYIDSANDYNFDFNGVLRAYIQDGTGSFIISSDERLKNSISEINGVLNNVLSLKPKRYSYKNDQSNKEQIGFIAQDVEELFPEAVSEKDGYKGINYAVFGVLAIEAIKEQQSLIENLTKRIEDLESRK
ncbi:MAG: tail fiber domain-containing protein [Ignavibacteriae bacterium]|nr:tail fiber domain-containing protein [Ignavibacteriota bacterium]